MDAYSFLSVALVIRPCSSLDLDHRVDFFMAKISIPNSHFLVVGVIVIGIVSLALLASYIFYPAYANNAGGGLSCTAATLVGEKKDMRPGKYLFNLPNFITMYLISTHYPMQHRNYSYITQIIFSP